MQLSLSATATSTGAVKPRPHGLLSLRIGFELRPFIVKRHHSPVQITLRKQPFTVDEPGGRPRLYGNPEFRSYAPAAKPREMRIDKAPEPPSIRRRSPR
ncbi:hypothetical protein ACFU99_10220 [Streptomyces sp. NPDC057654]|uniref:hypothetical protein n=1 Tax=Streptomyces sp. NPDC057654 TaxID=3346196 RepID=UPI0036A7706B